MIQQRRLCDRLQVHPLDGHQQICDHSTGTFKYFLKVVPTEYQNPRGHKFQTSQFSVTGAVAIEQSHYVRDGWLACMPRRLLTTSSG